MNNVLVEEGKALVFSRPREADQWSIVTACCLLWVINVRRMDWSDWLCVAFAVLNLSIYGYRAWRYRLWSQRRDAWLRQLKG